MKLLVKICGIRTVAAARAARQAGADFIGLNFVPSSKRRITLARARAIIKSLPKNPRPKIVGVFQNQPLAEVNNISKILNLDLVQLHGNESPAYCRQIQRPIIKAFGLQAGFNLKKISQAMSKYRVKYFLLDRVKRGRGKVLDFKKVAQLAKTFPIILSGGLTAENIGGAIRQAGKIQAVDVAGGVETGGKEDLSKIKKFIKIAKKLKK